MDATPRESHDVFSSSITKPTASERQAAAKTTRKPEVDESVVIPGDAEQIAQETADVSPEKRPGDPKTGPNGLRLEVLVGFFLVVCFAIGLGLWVNVAAGVAAGVVGTLGLMVNPVVAAASQRANEREAVAEHHKRDDPDAVVIRTTSKRKERRESGVM